MTSYGYNKRDKFEKRVYEIWEGCGLDWIQLQRNQGADNVLLGLYPQVVEVKNSNVYKLTDAEIEMKERVEAVGGHYWVVYDEATALAVADAARGLDVKMPFDR